MATTVVKSVKRDGTGNFTTILNWEIGRRGNLTTGGVDNIPGGVIEVAEIYGRAVNGDVGGVELLAANWTTSATCYPVIRAAAGHECNGKFDTTKAYMSYIGGGETWTGIRCWVNYLRFGPGISVYSSQPIRFDNLTAGTVLIERCVLKHISVGLTINNCNAIFDVKNCIIYYNTTGGGQRGVWFLYSTQLNLYNNTIAVIGSAPESCITIQGNNVNGQHVYSDNNYLCCGTGSNVYLNNGGATLHKGANDATSTTEAITPALRSIAYTTANFINVTGGSEDLHLQPTSVLVMKGATISSVTNDIDGDNRVGLVYDIGADQQSDIPVCWNYTAKFKGSKKLFKTSGGGVFPKNLRIPGNIDKSTGRMIDDGVEIDPSEYGVY